jgi:hypothetical protein
MIGIDSLITTRNVPSFVTVNISKNGSKSLTDRRDVSLKVLETCIMWNLMLESQLRESPRSKTFDALSVDPRIYRTTL